MSPQPPPSDWIVRRRRSGRIKLVDYDPTWPASTRPSRRGSARDRDTAVVLEHAGSTSVPGLAAKNQIDVVLGVPDSTDEARTSRPSRRRASSSPSASRSGSSIACSGRDPKVNLHTFSADCEEIGGCSRSATGCGRTRGSRAVRAREAPPRRQTGHHAGLRGRQDRVVREIVGRALAADSTDVHGTTAVTTDPVCPRTQIPRNPPCPSPHPHGPNASPPQWVRCSGWSSRAHSRVGDRPAWPTSWWATRRRCHSPASSTSCSGTSSRRTRTGSPTSSTSPRRASRSPARSRA